MNNSVLWIGSLIAAVAIAAPAGYLVRDSQIAEDDPYRPLGFTQCSYILPETFQVEYSAYDRLSEGMPSSSADVPFLNTRLSINREKFVVGVRICPSLSGFEVTVGVPKQS